MADPLTLGLLLFLGTWTALDGTSVGQFMVSRPLVAGTLAGWILGDPALGFLVGGILEGMQLAAFPIGAARLPEPGPAAIPAVLVAVELGGAGGVAIGTGIGVAWSLLGGSTVVAQRRLNGILMAGAEDGRVSERGLALRHWGCIATDGARGATLTLAGLVVAAAIPQGMGANWIVDAPATLAFLILPSALAGGALLRSWVPSKPRGALFLLAAVGGWALAQWL